MRIKATRFFLFLLAGSIVLFLPGAANQAQETAECRIHVLPGESIQDAIDHAPEGAVIHLEEGKWQENIRITKNVTIQAAEHSIIAGIEEGPVILIEGSEKVEVTIDSLHVTGAEGNSSAIKVEVNVHVSLNNCTISENQTRALWVEGQAQVTLEDCVLSDNRGDSIRVSDSSRVFVNQCDISNNAGNALVAWGSSSAHLKECTIMANGDDGLWIMDSTQAVVEECTICSNDGDGVYAHEKAKLDISNNRFLDNTGFGILVDSPDVVMHGQRNHMIGNGADLGGYARSTLRSPLAQETKQLNLSVPGDYSSLQEAVDAITPGGEITVGQAVFSEGVTIWKPLTLQGNGKTETIMNPRPDGRIIISILAEAKDVDVRNLTLTGSEEVALSIFGNQVNIEDCQVFGNPGTGIYVLGPASVNLKSCSLSENGESGVVIGGSAEASLIDCILAENEWDGLRAGGNASANLINCISIKNTEGVTADQYASVSLKDCVLAKNRQRGLIAGFEAQVSLNRCNISHNKRCGLVAEDWSQMRLQDCSICYNEEEGIVGKRATTISMDNCTVFDNGGSGLQAWDIARLFLSGCVVFENGEDGIYLQDKVTAELNGCHVLCNQGYGVRAYRPECIGEYIEGRTFAGKIMGNSNVIPGCKETNGNVAGAICPAYPGDPWPDEFLSK